MKLDNRIKELIAIGASLEAVHRRRRDHTV